MRARILVLVGLVLSGAGGCATLKPGRCNNDNDCQSGFRCDLTPTPDGNGRCVAKRTDGGDPDGSADKPGDGGTDQTGPDVSGPCTATSCLGAAPVCDDASKACRACAAGIDCATRDAAKPICLPTGACAECGASSECSAAAKPICEATLNVCRACGTGAECAARDAKAPVCATSGLCVECVANGDCKIAGKPVCNTGTNTCRTCKVDAECPADPGVCMEDGHCATAAEVIFVEFNAVGCPSADGSSAKPYCAPNEAVAALTSARHAIVIRGASDAKMTIGTTGVNPVVIGRKSATGDPGSLPAGAGAALTISSDDVLVRDLIIKGGTGSGSKGIVAQGVSTKVRLVRISVDLGTGRGISAEGLASLTMDQCTIRNSPAGGVYINGASYNIQNSVIAGNGLGAVFTASAVSVGSQFRFNTVEASTTCVCDPGNPQVLQDSIVACTNSDCTLVNSLMTAPTFSATKPFHLASPLPCPTAPASFPDHDIDGDPRVAPADCGADQYVP